MSVANEFQEYNNLIAEIRHNMELYYDRDEPAISDYEYDRLMIRLKKMEKDHPEWVKEDSPTRIIGGQASAAAVSDEKTGKRTAGVLIEHNVPMLSIQDVFTKEEVIEWAKDVRRLHPDASFCVEEKIDGLSMTLRYENGKLAVAETRGDGITGEDVTPNAKAIADVVQSLKSPYEYLELRGEVYMSHEAFRHINELQEIRGKKTFANPRNCAAGTLRQLDFQMVKERELSFFVFNVQSSSDNELLVSHHKSLNILEERENIKTAKSMLCKTDDEILEAIDEIGKRRNGLAYDIDGAVIKIDQLSYRDDFPAGSKYSAGHIAYKYPPEEKVATITDIELSVGMTGRINPTAVFTPISLCGTTVSRATLHNQDFIDRLGIGIGKKVLVYKSGEIIPKIRRVVDYSYKDGQSIDIERDEEELASAAENDAEKNISGRAFSDEDRNKSGIYIIPRVCPVCSGRVARVFDGADMICTNDDCSAKLTRRIINFVSRDAMDIKGFGDEYIKLLIDQKYIRNIADLYTLNKYRDELVEKGLIGKETNTDKLLSAIEASKSNEPWRLLSGLSIANVGRTGARTLMRRFKSIEKLANASISELKAVNDIGEITANAVHDWFSNEDHKTLIERLKSEGVNMPVEPARVSDPSGFGENPADTVSASALNGRTYCVTGDVTRFKNRNELIEYIEGLGGKVSGSVSKKTYALINNDVTSSSGKNKKAKELGIPVLSEEDFLSSLK